MNPFIFWRNWPLFFRIFFGLLLGAFCVLGILLIYFHFSGTANILGWDVFARTETLDLPVDAFDLDLFHFTTKVNTALFWQYFEGASGNVNMISYYFFLVITVAAFQILITVITDLKGFWYFVGASLLVAALVNYKFELLFLFGRDDKIGLIIAFLAYVPLTFYFNKIKTDVPFGIRLACFSGITILFGLLIYFFAETNQPFFYLATSGFFNPFIISLIFILMVAHQIIVGLTYLITVNNTGGHGHSLRHFLIVMAIYLVNLLLVYMHEANIVEWNLIYINLFVLFLFSAFIGIWSYKLQAEQYGYLFRYFPTGIFFYCGMMLCALVTMIHLSATVNDPGIEVFNDIIIYSHLGYGLIFFVYILTNFISPLGENLKVYRILYKPANMPYFTFRLAGFITFLAMVYAANIQVPLHQAQSAYYNGVGDMYNNGKDWLFARQYYDQAGIYGFNNHKSNYILGDYYRKTKEYGKAINHYKNANAKWPTPQSYINLSNTYLDSDQFFDALFTLKEGKKLFPEDPHILNNLGLIYNKTNILDTAFLLLDKSVNLDNSEAAAKGNIIGLLAKNVVTLNVDSVLKRYNDPEDLIILNNSLVWKNTQFDPYPVNYTPHDSVVTFLESYLMYNQAMNHLYRDDSLATAMLTSYALQPKNISSRDRFELAVAFNQYKNKQVDKAFRLINWIGNRNLTEGGDYFVYGGKWALQQNAPDVAVDYFSWAVDRQNADAPFLLAIALSENRDKRAYQAWQQLKEKASWKEIAGYMAGLYEVRDADFTGLTGNQQLHYLHFIADRNDSSHLSKLVSQVSDPQNKALAILDISQSLFEIDQLLPAIQWFARLSGIHISDKAIFDRIQWYELQLLAAQNNIRGLASKINDGIKFDKEHLIEKVYYTTLIQQSAGNMEKAKKGYQWLANSNPFKEEVIISAADFINSTDKFEAYNILLKAIEINPESIKLLKAYVLQCARTQFDSYAEISLDQLKQLMKPNRYQAFKRSYKELARQEAEMD